MDVEQPDALSFEDMKKQKASSQTFCPERPLRSYKDFLIQPTRDWEDHSLQNLRIRDTDIDSDRMMIPMTHAPWSCNRKKIRNVLETPGDRH